MVIDITKARESREMDDNRILVAECIREEAEMLREDLSKTRQADQRRLMFMMENYRTRVMLANILTTIESDDRAKCEEFLVEYLHEVMLFTQLVTSDLKIDMREVVKKASAMPDEFK